MLDWDDIKDSKIKVHIRIQPRTSRTYLTIIEGLIERIQEENEESKELIKKILKKFKKNFSCNGSIIENKNNEAIQLQGDHRHEVAKYLIEKDIVSKDNIIVHGI